MSIKLFKEQLGFSEAKALIEENKLNLITLSSEEGMSVVVGLLTTYGVEDGWILLHESFTGDDDIYTTVYSIGTDEVVKVLVLPDSKFYLPYVEVPITIPICECGDTEVGYEITIEFSDSSMLISKAVCRSCSNVYGLKYILTEVVRLPKDEE